MKKLILSFIAIGAVSMLQAQNVGIGTNTPTEKLHVQGGARVTSLSGVGYRLVSSSATGVLANVPDGTAGQFLTTNGAGGYTWASPPAGNADNGLYFNAGASSIRMGGPLVENTLVSVGGFSMDWDLNGTGDFSIQDAGVDMFQIRDDGIAFFADDVYWRDGTIGGTNLMSLIDDGNDGRLRIYENGLPAVDFDANTKFAINEQGYDRDSYIESNNQPDMFYVNAGTDQVFVNRTAHHAGYTDHFSVYQAGNTVPFCVNGWNQGATGGAATFQITTAQGYKAVECTTPGTGTGVWGWHTAGAGNGIGVQGTTNSTFTGWAGFFEGDVGCTGTYFGSDERWKKNIQDLDANESMLAKVLQLRPTSYEWKADEYPGMSFNPNRTSYGFIAQELDLVFPDLVENEKGIPNPTEEHKSREATEMVEGYYMVDYVGLIPVLTKAIQEQQEIIEDLQERIEELEGQVGITPQMGQGGN